jgi:hypothetical protein
MCDLPKWNILAKVQTLELYPTLFYQCLDIVAVSPNVPTGIIPRENCLGM